MLNPRDDHRRLLAGRFVDLQYVNRDAVRQFLRRHCALRGSQRAVARARELIGGDAIGRIRLHNQPVASAGRSRQVLG